MKTLPSKEIAALQPDLCVLGAGPAALSLAAMGALLGISVVLAEGEVSAAESDGVAAAALRASGNRAHSIRTASNFGIGKDECEPELDISRLRAHLAKVIGNRAPLNSSDRYRAMGVRVVRGSGNFTGPLTFRAGNVTIKARRFVIVPPSVPAIPEIPGLATAPYLTSDSILKLEALPRQMLILGGGPDAISLAQTFRRLGALVTILVPEERLLIGEDPEIVAVIDRALRQEGVDLRLGTAIEAIENGSGGTIVARLAGGGDPAEGSHLVVANGRVSALEGLGLSVAGIKTDPDGIVVDRRMRTSNAKVYAIGSSSLAPQHVAAQAVVAFRNAVLRLPTRFDPASVPRVVHCDPEMAFLGLTEPQARTERLAFRVLRAPFSDNVRAVADDAAIGHLKALVTPAGKIIGCSIVGPRAHDLIEPWALASASGLSITDLAALHTPTPGYSEVTRAAAVEFLKLSAQGPWLRRALGFMRRWG